MGWINFDSVIGQMAKYGLEFDAADVCVGKKVKCTHSDDKKREKRGWFKLWDFPAADGSGYFLAGRYGAAWGAEYETFEVTIEKSARSTLTKEQLEAMRARRREEQKEEERQRKRVAEECARRADFAWRMHCKEGSRDQSAYLKRKQIEANGGRFLPGGKFCIPIQDADRRTYGLQIIYDEKKNGRDKSFWPAGLAKKGHFFLFGGIPDRLILLAEGFATGASLHQATGYPVAVGFDAGNLLPVAKALKAKYKRARILVCADDDYRTEGNPGVTSAQNAALAVDGGVAIPLFKDERPADKKGPTDFNDLHLADGQSEVARQIEATLSALGWAVSSAPKAGKGHPGGGEKSGERRQAQSVMDLDDIVDRFVPLDDGTGDYVFDLWTNKVAKRSQMIALLPAGVRGDDIKRHPVWITRGAYYLDQVGFDPSEKDNGVKLNTWKGWPMTAASGKCDTLLDLIGYLCGKESNPAIAEWLLDWMAYPLQNPGAKMSSAVIMHGPQGTGKSTIFQTLAKIYGDYATVLNQRGLEDKFNSDWSDSKLFILAEEVVTRAEMWHIKNELKELVTGEWIRINPKNVAAYRQRNQVNIAYLSNENQPLPLDNDDRRHLVIYTPVALSESFYDELNIELDNGGIAAFYDFLLRRDLSNFHPKKRPPMTEAKKKLIALSAASEIRFINDWITGDIGLPVVPCISTDLYAAYLKWCRLNGESRPRPSNQFHGAIEHMVGWEKKKAKLYLRETDMQTTARPVVFPPVAVLQAAGITPAAPGKETTWLGECCRRFADGLSGSDYAERSAA